MVHDPLTVPLPMVMVASLIPAMLPPVFCMLQPLPIASIWKKSAAVHVPVKVPLIAIVSPASQLEESPPEQEGDILAVVRTHGCTVVVDDLYVVVEALEPHPE
jgi:hypothetical protein